jgi:hypothetical protein
VIWDDLMVAIAHAHQAVVIIHDDSITARHIHTKSGASQMIGKYIDGDVADMLSIELMKSYKRAFTTTKSAFFLRTAGR